MQWINFNLLLKCNKIMHAFQYCGAAVGTRTKCRARVPRLPLHVIPGYTMFFSKNWKNKSENLSKNSGAAPPDFLYKQDPQNVSESLLLYNIHIIFFHLKPPEPKNFEIDLVNICKWHSESFLVCNLLPS